MKYFFLFLVVFIFSPLFAFANDADLDHTFHQGTGIDAGGVNALAIQPNGKILIGGSFNSYNGFKHRGIIRIDQDGSIDVGFNKGYGLNSCIDEDGYDNCAINTISIQPDGKIIVGGTFTHFNNLETGSLIRLNPDGSLDENFINSNGFNNSVYTSLVEPDGKILVGGNFTLYKDINLRGLARLNTDGTLDETFNFSPNEGTVIYDIGLQSNGKIIIGGWFNTINNMTSRNIARLNHNGYFDKSFETNGTNGFVTSIAVEPDDRIIIAGNFTMYDGVERNRVAKINENGNLNKKFNPQNGANNIVRTLSIQKNGQIIVGGQFTLFNDKERKHIARLNDDGSLDNEFDPGKGTNDHIFTLLIQPNGKILIGGYFTDYDGTPINYLARLKGSQLY